MLFVLNDTSVTSTTTTNLSQASNSSGQVNQTQLIPLIGRKAFRLSRALDTEKRRTRTRKKNVLKRNLIRTGVCAYEFSFVLAEFFFVLLFASSIFFPLLLLLACQLVSVLEI